MWLPNRIRDEVDEVATVRYINRVYCEDWNQRRGDELRLLTGFVWESKDHRHYQQGLKTKTAAYRDCWYRLVQKQTVPSLTTKRVRLRTINGGKRRAA
jgi:hypothetical protein